MPNAEELRSLREVARRYVDECLVPLERAVEEGLDEEVWQDLTRQCYELGLRGLWFPSEYGGGDGGALEACVVLREFGRTSHSFLERLLFSVDASLHAGTPEQCERWLRPAIRGDIVCAFGLTESEAGSDAAAVRTTATRVEGGWVINGQKVFTTLASISAVVTVIAATGATDQRRPELTAFLVPTDSDGFRCGSENDKVGFRGVPQSAIFLDDCFVPDEAVLGGVGEGWKVVTGWANQERLMQAAWCLGAAERSLDLAIDYANQRVTFGKPLGQRQAIQWMVADSVVECLAIHQMVGETARLIDAGGDPQVRSAAVKLLSAERSARVIDRAQQVFGGMGYMRDLPFDQLLRDVRLARIGGGSSEMMRLIISRDALRNQRATSQFDL